MMDGDLLVNSLTVLTGSVNPGFTMTGQVLQWDLHLFDCTWDSFECFIWFCSFQSTTVEPPL